jgi:hypothetical protein
MNKFFQNAPTKQIQSFTKFKMAFMKKHYYTALLLFLLCPPLSILAQNTKPQHVCGTSMETQELMKQDMLDMRHRYPHGVNMRAIAYIPVWVHNVARTDGTGRMPMNRVLDMLCEVNRLFMVNNVELRFYIKGVNNVNNSSLYDSPKSFGGDQSIRRERKTDGLNMYLVSRIPEPDRPTITVLGYYLNRSSSAEPQYSSDWLVIAHSEISTGRAVTLAHELGHGLSLAHTFFGWEDCPFNATAAVPCAPATVSCFVGGTYDVEKSPRTGAGANCTTAADGFCDTPPDYNFGLLPGATCNYTGLAKDPNCVAFDVAENNMMSYFTGCETTFSAQQKAAMEANYTNHAARAYLRSGNLGPSGAALVAPTLTAPANNATTQFFNNFTLAWDAVPNASNYVIEVSKLASMNAAQVFTANTNFINLNTQSFTAGYLPNGGIRLYWRVKPYNSHSFCAPTSATQSFLTGTVNSVSELANISTLEVSPNPLSNRQDLRLSLATEKPFTAQVKMINLAGQVVRNEKRYFEAGNSVQTLSTQNLSSGLYFLTVETESGILNKKVVIQN